MDNGQLGDGSEERGFEVMGFFRKRKPIAWYEKIQQEVIENAKAFDSGQSESFQAVDIPEGYIYCQRVILPTEVTWKNQQCSIDPKSPNCSVCTYNYACNRYRSVWGE